MSSNNIYNTSISFKPPPFYSCGMNSPLRELRKKEGWSQEKLGQMMGITKDMVSKLERGERELRPMYVQKLVSILGISADELLGTSPPDTINIPIIAYVGAGAEVYPVDDHAKGQGISEVEMRPYDAPPSLVKPKKTMVGLQVQGDSMYPAYRDGDQIFYNREYDFDESACLNNECVVEIVDGPTLVKTVRKGSQVGLYMLESYNAPPRYDEKLAWACPVLWVKRG